MELLIRQYESGREVRCLVCDSQIISLDETFDDDGGLTQYEIYGVGTSYTYRELTFKELIELKMPNNNIVVCQWRRVDINVSDEVDKIKKREIKEFRKEKLKQLEIYDERG